MKWGSAYINTSQSDNVACSLIWVMSCLLNSFQYFTVFHVSKCLHFFLELHGEKRIYDLMDLGSLIHFHELCNNTMIKLNYTSNFLISIYCSSTFEVIYIVWSCKWCIFFAIDQKAFSSILLMRYGDFWGVLPWKTKFTYDFLKTPPIHNWFCEI